MNAFEAAEANGRTADLEEELDALFNAQNDSPNARLDLDPGNVPARDCRRLSEQPRRATLDDARHASGTLPLVCGQEVDDAAG